jgi:hypothetical protein
VEPTSRLSCDAAAGASAPGQGASLRLIRTIPLPGVDGVFNQMTADPVRQILYAAAPTKRSLEVIDLKTGKPICSLTQARPASSALAPDLDWVFIPRLQDVGVYDARTFEAVTNVNLGNHANEIQYDQHAGRLYAACQNVGRFGLAIIDVKTLSVLGTIALPAKPMGFVREEKGNRIFVNLPTLGQIAVLDQERQVILNSWVLKDMAANYPIALDEARQRLFVGCRKPPEIAVYDTASGRVVATPRICADADGVFYDAERRRIYVSGGEGFLDVIDQRDADTYVLRDHIRTAPGARNSLFSPAMDLVFVAVPQHDNPVAEIRIFQPPE